MSSEPELTDEQENQAVEMALELTEFMERWGLSVEQRAIALGGALGLLVARSDDPSVPRLLAMREAVANEACSAYLAQRQDDLGDRLAHIKIAQELGAMK